MLRPIAVGLAVFGIANAAYADVSVKDYLDLRKEPGASEKLRDYVTGLGRGMFVYAINDETKGRTPAFCVPAKLPLTAENYQQLLDNYLRDHRNLMPALGKQTIEIVLLYALIDAFPCQ
ncbi:MAG TPA: hypothetical protein VMU06_01290 [Stellaceae bacterium]|nr:hypothetical protein [Stellaceae bacterium]